jgi:hypothetical protein
VVAEIADLIDLPHAAVELARFNGFWGSLSREFDELLTDGVDLVHGNELLAGHVSEYAVDRRFGQSMHTLGNILSTVAAATGRKGGRDHAFTIVGGYVVLDALVLNTDRHHENWAMFREIDGTGEVCHTMAPSFDHASSLGRELTQARLRAWSSEHGHVSRYAGKGRGGVFLRTEDRHGANPLKLAEVAFRRWPRYLSPWLDNLDRVGIEPMQSVLRALPPELISPESRDFAGKLLSYTYSRLMELNR